jgi:TrmH family RNA methyltransferase
MIAKKINSLQHPIIKLAVKLRNNKKFRLQENKVLLCGNKLVKEVVKKIKAHHLFYTSSSHDLVAENIYQVNDSVMKKIFGLPSAEDLAAIISLPTDQTLKTKGKYLVLDQISDPGNLGTLLRSALAFRFQGAIITSGSVDPFNDKAIRASKGACFFLPLIRLESEEIFSHAKKHKIPIFLADMTGKNFHKCKIPPSFFLILSNESHGVSSFWKTKVENISIPISKEMESLNVSVAGSILMEHFSSKN